MILEKCILGDRFTKLFAKFSSVQKDGFSTCGLFTQYGHGQILKFSSSLKPLVRFLNKSQKCFFSKSDPFKKLLAKFLSIEKQQLIVAPAYGALVGVKFSAAVRHVLFLKKLSLGDLSHIYLQTYDSSNQRCGDACTWRQILKLPLHVTLSKFIRKIMVFLKSFSNVQSI